MRHTVALAVALLVAVLCVFATPVAHAECAPSTRGVFPASGVVGTTVNATVGGTGLSGASAEVFGGPGLTVTVQSATDLEATLQLQIAPDAAPGERIIELTTSGGTAFVGFTVNAAGGPVVASVTPAPIATLGFGLDLVVTGQDLVGIGPEQVSVSGAGVTVDEIIADPAGAFLEIALDVAADADLGTHALVIDTDAGGAIVQVYVQRPSPSIDGVFPSAGEVGAVVPLTITGEHLTGASLVITSGAGSGGGVQITGVSTPDDTTLQATVTIAPALTPETEPRLLIVTTESGQRTAEFSILAGGVPSLTGASPAAAEPGTTTAVTLRGLNLTGAVVTEDSADLSLANVAVVDDETISLDVVVAGGAATDVDRPITVIVGQDMASVPFRVIASGEPFVGAVRPPFGNRGEVVTLVLDGVNLGSLIPGSGVQLSGPKITESNAEAIDANTVRATLDLDVTASVGFRDVEVTTAQGQHTSVAAFRVNVPGQVPTISDVTPGALEPGTTTTMTVTGAGLLDAGVTVGGPGATVSNTAVDLLGEQVTFDLTLAADAPAEIRPVVVTTENGIARCHVRSLPPEIALSAAQLVKSGSVFEATSGGYRLFLFEFSLNERFETGLRTVAIASPGPRVTLSRLDDENIRRAVRDLPFGYVRVRAVTATSQVGTSGAHRFRR